MQTTIIDLRPSIQRTEAYVEDLATKTGDLYDDLGAIVSSYDGDYSLPAGFGIEFPIGHIRARLESVQEALDEFAEEIGSIKESLQTNPSRMRHFRFRLILSDGTWQTILLPIPDHNKRMDASDAKTIVSNYVRNTLRGSLAATVEDIQYVGEVAPQTLDTPGQAND